MPDDPDAANSRRRPPCTIVVPTRDRPVQLARCLASLHVAMGRTDELIVVDSASTTPEVARVATEAGATLIRCDRPGVDRARNCGWRAAQHEYVLFVDDDVIVDPGWADALVGALVTHPDTGFVTGRIDPMAGGTAERPVAVKQDVESTVLLPATEGTLGHSASMAMPKAALHRVAGFDEEMGAGARFRSAPEVDLFDRLFAAGYAGWYDADAQAWHEQWRQRRDLVRLDWRYGFGSGARIAKLVRSDHRRAAAVAREVLWRNGLRTALRDLRNGYQAGVAYRLAKVAGALVGFALAIVTPVRDGHFAPRRDRHRTAAAAQTSDTS